MGLVESERARAVPSGREPRERATSNAFCVCLYVREMRTTREIMYG